MKIGFTGTRSEPTFDQCNWLFKYLCDNKIDELHHGACVGADSLAHYQAALLNILIYVHPPTDLSRVNKNILDVEGRMYVLKPKPYLVRNHDIVDSTDRLIALPKDPETLRSGTWSTIRYAQKKKKPITICWPDGRCERR